jgi:anti-anti-sigma factor
LLLRGELEGDVPSEVLKRELERHYVDDGVRTICVKLDQLDLITLDGVGILLELWTESRRRGKRFIVQDAHGQVREKLRISGLLGTFSGSEEP